MNENTTRAEMTKEEFEKFVNAIKFAAFEKWANESKKEKERLDALADEIEKRTGIKKHTPANLTVLAFIEGMDAGVDLIDNIKKELENKQHTDD